jgi:DNA-binding NarL/FixJ family response regulator
MTTFVLADDHPVVLKGLRALLATQKHYEIIGEATDGLSAIDLISEQQPDVAILDVQLPDLNGLEVARRAQKKSHQTRIVILSMHSDEAFVREAFRTGALGYVLKGSTTADLLRAVEAALEGQRFLSEPLAARAIDAYAEQSSSSVLPLDRYEMLTAREREVLQLAAQGETIAEIGERLSISPRTAETHRINLLRKLGLTSQTDLVKFAIVRKLIEPSV